MVNFYISTIQHSDRETGSCFSWTFACSMLITYRPMLSSCYIHFILPATVSDKIRRLNGTIITTPLAKGNRKIPAKKTMVTE